MRLSGDFRLIPDEVLSDLAAKPAEAAAFLYGEEVSSYDRMIIDRAWHGIHFLLNGAAWAGDPPLDFIVRGGKDLGHDDGHGPARGFSAVELKAISAALEPFIPGILRKRFQVQAMLDEAIYPNAWTGEEREWLIDTYQQLKRFLYGGAERGLGLVVVTSRR